MAVEAYIPTQVTLGGEVIPEVFVVTLYDPQGDHPRGSMTTAHPLPAGRTAGPLVVTGRRDGRLWRITAPQIEVINRSAVGFEYSIRGPLERAVLGDAPDVAAGRPGQRLENLGATF